MVSVSFSEPGKRRTSYFVVDLDNIRYLTVEQDGVIVCGSRTEVPCESDCISARSCKRLTRRDRSKKNEVNVKWSSDGGSVLI